MLGKMSSVVQVVDLLRVKGVSPHNNPFSEDLEWILIDTRKVNNYAITEFVQGQTRRWAVGWSFLNGRLPDVGSNTPSFFPFLHNFVNSRYPGFLFTLLIHSLLTCHHAIPYNTLYQLQQQAKFWHDTWSTCLAQSRGYAS
jgi:hypothetical protein